MRPRSVSAHLRSLQWLALGSLPPLAATALLVQHVVFGNSIGGLQFSDAGGWADCARSIAAFDRLPDLGGDWCMRRPATPYLVGALTSLLGSLNLSLIALSLVMGFAWAWMIREANLLAGGRLAAGLGLLVLPLWLLWGMNQVLSEAIALPLACVAAAALLRGWQSGDSRWHLVVVAAIAWAEQFRPANLLMLVPPLLLAAAVHRIRPVRLLAASGYALLPYCIVWMRSYSLGYRETGQGGNGWATIYGFVTGNRPWALAVADISGYATASDESTRWRLVRDAALHAFAAEPVQAIRSLFVNILALSTNAWLVVGMGALAIATAAALSASYWVALFVGMRRSGSHHLMLAVSLATLSTLTVWALILPAGLEGLRVMSTAIPTLAALHVIALARQAPPALPPTPTDRRSQVAVALLLAIPAVLGVLILAPWSAAEVQRDVDCAPRALSLETSTLQWVRTAELRVVTARLAPHDVLPYVGMPNVTLVEGVAVSSTGSIIPVRYSTTRRGPQPRCIRIVQAAGSNGFSFATLRR